MSAMNEVFPIMLMNDERYCTMDNGGVPTICNCQNSRSDTILKIMLLTGGSFLGNSPQVMSNFILHRDFSS